MVAFGLYYCLFHHADSLALGLLPGGGNPQARVSLHPHRRRDQTTCLPILTSELPRRTVKDGAQGAQAPPVSVPFSAKWR